MFNHCLILLFGTVSEATRVGPCCQVVGPDHLLMVPSYTEYTNKTKQINILLNINMRLNNLLYFAPP